jgi:cytochrome c oxidase subunit 1
VVTLFGGITQIHRSGLKWDFVPLCLLLGLTGWIVGGLAAVVDSTVMVNFFFHNTQWVPAHFHTYFLVGFVLMLFAFTYHFVGAKMEKTAKLSLWTMIVGGYGFLLMFYLAGVESVPRRFADYTATGIDAIKVIGQATAMIATVCIVVFVAGLLLYYATVVRGLGTWSGKTSPTN